MADTAKAIDALHAIPPDLPRDEWVDVLKARGIPFVEIAHWNFGPASRKSDVPPNDTRYDPDWYKQNPRKRGLLNKAIDAFCDFIGIHRAGAPFRNRLRD